MRVPNRSYVVPALLADELARAGVRHACVTPGSRSAPLALALAAQPSVRVWTHLDERSAAFFALGLAKAARAPVALACTSGTAAANFLPAVVEAFHARVPLVVLTADRPAELRDCGAPQTIDQLRLFGSHVRWFVDAALPDATVEGLRAARALACRAVATACGPPAGPVHLNVPLREPLAPEPVDDPALAALAAEPAAAGRVTDSSWTRIHPPARAPAPAAIDSVARLLATARRPLVVCGPLDDPAPDLPDRLGEVAHRLGAPVLAEPASNLRRPAIDDVLVDAHDAVLRVAAFRRAHLPDVVVRIGALPTSKALAGWLGDHPEVPQIVLDGDGGWSDAAGVASTVVAGAPAAILAALCDATRAPEPDPRWLTRWRRAGAAARSALRRTLDETGDPFEGHAIVALSAALPVHATLYAGNSLAIRDLDWFWPAGAPPVRVLANRGANGIDGFVSSVLGAAVLPGPTVGLCGDLSFLHDLGGLLAAHRHGVRATFVVLDNDGGGIFDHLPIAGRAERYEELFVTPHGIALGPLVDGYGVAYRCVHDVSTLPHAITAALAAAGTTVIHVPFARTHSLAIHRRAWAVAAADIGGVA